MFKIALLIFVMMALGVFALHAYKKYGIRPDSPVYECMCREVPQ